MEDTKKCTKCDEELPLDRFYKRRYKSGKTGTESRCKGCANTASAKWQKNNRERIAIRERNRRAIDPDYRMKKRVESAIWRDENSGKVSAASAQYRKDNPEKIKASVTKWRKNNPGKYKTRKGAYEKERRAGDINYRIMCNIRTAISSTIIGNKKAAHTEGLLGCSIGEFKNHLERLFFSGMSWDNYGRYGWHIDHIIPLSYFDFSDPEQQKRAWHYTNLRPLWAEENVRKGAKIIEIQLTLI